MDDLVEIRFIVRRCRKAVTPQWMQKSASTYGAQHAQVSISIFPYG